ncbi:fibrobacter succinogenes major paralogous domain-containing protein [Ornithobacterium rhinotracheale]|uniref:fibrobacter succinogenes major paralogous domain-containing protein n=1 Tax=Ornithobacterium rhinotracheale TaxID=28251 RepID=UPI002158D423|nr:fibrobacter succinogenes major paralogous domain-containing protein [Ornithobacterium rhinotracheale]UVD87739.1 fibrobacter succinogenes major paralogous domain-containing protein [Ornithobacterium rhinotracheale]
MKKIFISLSLLGLAVGYAQNTTNSTIALTIDKNYFLDGSFNTFSKVSLGKGLNFPRTDLTKFEFSTTDLGGYQYSRTAFDGMIVYNTAKGTTGSNAATQGKQVSVTPGFYYFYNPKGTEKTTDLSEGQWVRLGAEAVAGTTLGTLPRYSTEERDKLKGVAEGTIIYNTTTKKVEVYNGTSWDTVSGVATTNPGGGTPVSPGTGPGTGVTPPPSTTTYSATKTGTYRKSFTRNNCGAGYIGGSHEVSHQSQATATSTISQEDADRKALDAAVAAATQWVIANGQREANSRGQCRQDPNSGVANLGNGARATLQDAKGYVVSLTYQEQQIQGKIDNGSNKVQIRIPYTGGNGGSYGSVIAQTQTIARAAQDGGSTEATLTIPAGQLASGNGYITAEVSTPSLYKVKMLAPGQTEKVAEFKVRINGQEKTVVVNAIGGIPDKNFNVMTNGKLEHEFIYVPIEGPDGRTWLNNNLGADYANVNSPHFNPTQQATSKTDYKAYGSMFQWGREANGHELVDWTRFIFGRVVHSNLSWSRDMLSSLTTYHDPCPNGYHTPSKSEWEQLFRAVGSGNSMCKDRKLNLPAAGYRYYTSGSQFRYTGGTGSYWSSTQSLYAWELYFNSSYSLMLSANRSYGQPVRCLKD